MTLYSIKDLEYLSGIKAHTIRIWEKRYGLLVPVRSETNIRAYTDEDVRRILNVAMLLKSGYKISNAAAMSDEKFQAEVIRLHRNLGDHEKNIDQLLYYTVNFDTGGFETILESLIAEHGFSKTIQLIVFPFFERIGVLWQAGSVYVAHEHFVSNLVRNLLIRETGKFNAVTSANSILFFLRGNEFHELALLYLNLLAAQNGVRGVYLGQNLPFKDLSGLLQTHRFNFVCTSFISAIEKAELEQYLAELSRVFSQSKILINGRQIGLHKPKLPHNVTVIRNFAEYIKIISG